MKNFIKIFFLSIVCLFIFQTILIAQIPKITVHITVKNSRDTACIAGATVEVVGTAFGVLTDANGQATFTCAPYSTLCIYYTGFKAQEVAASGYLSIYLEEEEACLYRENIFNNLFSPLLAYCKVTKKYTFYNFSMTSV